MARPRAGRTTCCRARAPSWSSCRSAASAHAERPATRAPRSRPRPVGSLRHMKLEGIHHITAITGDAPRNVDFYARVLGLRLVKKSVNQDDPTVYHLFYADERGDPGSDITFFEYPNALPGRAGAGMVHLITWRVASDDALAFWTERLAGGGLAVRQGDGPS